MKLIAIFIILYLGGIVFMDPGSNVCSFVETYREVYYTRCWWSRCTRYRMGMRTKYHCCEGWRPSTPDSASCSVYEGSTTSSAPDRKSTTGHFFKSTRTVEAGSDVTDKTTTTVVRTSKATSTKFVSTDTFTEGAEPNKAEGHLDLQSSTINNSGIVAGAVVGGLGLLITAVILVVILLIRRTKSNKLAKQSSTNNQTPVKFNKEETEMVDNVNYQETDFQDGNQYQNDDNLNDGVSDPTRHDVDDNKYYEVANDIPRSQNQTPFTSNMTMEDNNYYDSSDLTTPPIECKAEDKSVNERKNYYNAPMGVLPSKLTKMDNTNQMEENTYYCSTDVDNNPEQSSKPSEPPSNAEYALASAVSADEFSNDTPIQMVDDSYYSPSEIPNH